MCGMAVACFKDRGTGSGSPEKCLLALSPFRGLLQPYHGGFRLEDWVASGQTTNRERELHHPSAENCIKGLLSMALPTRARPSPSCQEAWEACLVSLDRRSKNYIPQTPKKANQYNHMITALYNSMKLRAMPCRATRDRWDTVASSDKMWSTVKGNGKPLQYSCLENTMNSMNNVQTVNK